MVAACGRDFYLLMGTKPAALPLLVPDRLHVCLLSGGIAGRALICWPRPHLPPPPPFYVKLQGVTY